MAVFSLPTIRRSSLLRKTIKNEGKYREKFLGFFLPKWKLSKFFSRFFPSVSEITEKDFSVFSFPNLTFLEIFLGFFQNFQIGRLGNFSRFFLGFFRIGRKKPNSPLRGEFRKISFLRSSREKRFGEGGLRPPSLEDLFPCRD